MYKAGMKRRIAIGTEDFECIRVNHWFYADKTSLIREWWQQGDRVTLITRPRRFGKTLNMSMLNCFFSLRYAGRKDLFEDLKVWGCEEMRKLQGTFPVVFLSFADVKPTSFPEAMEHVSMILEDLYLEYEWMLQDSMFSSRDRSCFYSVRGDMGPQTAAGAIERLCGWIERYYGKKVLLLLDEYDTPVQEAYARGFGDEMADFMRQLFWSTLEVNPSLERAVLTGIMVQEALVGSVNHVEAVTVTSSRYAASFGFTGAEVASALSEQGYPEEALQTVFAWYDGYTFGHMKHILNPWDVTMFLKQGKPETYWTDTGGSGLISGLLQRSSAGIKRQLGVLLGGGTIGVTIDALVTPGRISFDEQALWSLLLFTGYLKLAGKAPEKPGTYELALTSFEVSVAIRRMVKAWFDEDSSFEHMERAMLRGSELDMNRYLHRVLETAYSGFDAGMDGSETERFFLAAVLRLMVDLDGTYEVRIGPETGCGRCDVVMLPASSPDPAVILAFRTVAAGEEIMEDTAIKALRETRDLLKDGQTAGSAFRYGLVFRGKECLIRKG